MKMRTKYMRYGFLALTVFAGVVGANFYRTVVGPESTNFLSIWFGWQWLFVLGISLLLLILALLRRDRRLLSGVGIVLLSLLLVLTTAHFMYLTRGYITGDGGPAGPDMNCLIWNDSFKSGAYEHDFGWCTLMSMPSLNKFYIDRSIHADSNDSSFTYYLVLVFNEATIVGGIIIGNKISETHITKEMTNARGRPTA